MNGSNARSTTTTVAWLRNLQVQEVCNLDRVITPAQLSLPTQNGSSSAGSTQSNATAAIGIILLHASWNKRGHEYPREQELLTGLVGEATVNLLCTSFGGTVQVDETQESLNLCLGDDDHANARELPLPPEELPVLVVVGQTSNMEHSVWNYVSDIPNKLLRQALQGGPGVETGPISTTVQAAVREMATTLDMDVTDTATVDSGTALRIFVAGDRSSVGKSSVCLGILGCLLQAGYNAADLAYIKPATQSESTQLIELWCRHAGIACVPVGPLVYYRGFTRAFLAGETASTAELLQACGLSVDRVAAGKQVVLVDGVGFPAVGSICGTDNASVSRACGYPVDTDQGSNYERKPMGVVLVGGGGVGGAVDAFNLNATYFEMKEIPVLGAIFNKLSTDGYYSLENCKQQVTSYFDQNAYQQTMGRRAFGFVPLFPEIAGPEAMQHVEEYLHTFGAQVDVHAILEAATRAKEKGRPVQGITSGDKNLPHAKRIKLVAPPTSLSSRTREQIEAEAITSGAAPSA